jgi:asparagine synthase (glutamine-hydrolysing)
LLLQYKEYGTDLCSKLDGMFSFVLLDTTVTPSRVIAARDPIGITTLYQGWNSASPETIYFASELKALHEECDVVFSFPPGHVYDSSTKETKRYFQPTWWDGDKEGEEHVPKGDADLKELRESLETAVKKRLMSEVPYGVLLSGGLDSSLIAAIAVKETEKVAHAQLQAREMALKKGPSGTSTPDADGKLYLLLPFITCTGS